MIAIVHPRQSIFDVALQHFGSAEAAFLVAEKFGCSITDDLINVSTIEFSESEVLDKRIADYYRQNNIIPATALAIIEINPTLVLLGGYGLDGKQVDVTTQLDWEIIADDLLMTHPASAIFGKCGLDTAQVYITTKLDWSIN